jgi:hypothetical protein
MRSLILMEAERRGWMPKALDERAKSKAMQLIFTPSWMALVEEWRRHQVPVPNVSASIRRMVEIAAEVEAERRAKAPKPKPE